MALWYKKEILRLPFNVHSEYIFDRPLDIKLKGIEIIEVNNGFWTEEILTFSEEILHRFNYHVDYEKMDYNNHRRIMMRVIERINRWKTKIINDASVEYFITDSTVIGDAWNRLLNYAVDNNIEIDVFKIFDALFVEGKFKTIFHKKNYYLYDIYDVRKKFDKVMLDGYMKDIYLKAIDKELEDSKINQYTYSIIDLLNLQN